MSNHDGSYMLNEVLQYLLNDQATPMGQAFRAMSASDRVRFFCDILRIGQHHDCNDGEIMSFIGYQYGFCYLCCKTKEPPKVQEPSSDYDVEFYLCEDCGK
jgi:hypothetical protein